MPWFPDFIGAGELARRERRAAGLADPVKQYLTALTSGDANALEAVWPGEVVVHDPRAGEIRGRQQLRQFVRDNQSWLATQRARVDVVASTAVRGRAVMELLTHLRPTEQPVAWPVAVVAESLDENSVVFRTYCSQWPVDGQRHLRPPILTRGAARLGDVVQRYQSAVEAGNVEAVLATFVPDGYYREPTGPRPMHRGTVELRSFFTAQLSFGGIRRDPCEVTDDGVRCAVEYTCVRWGNHAVPPQAGLGVFERSPDGLLAAVRVYDDVLPPGDDSGRPR